MVWDFASSVRLTPPIMGKYISEGATFGDTIIGVSPLSKLSDTSLHTVSNETHYRIIGLDSRIAQLAVIDTIYNLISMQKTDEDMLQVENAMKGRKY